MSARQAKVERATRETRVRVFVDLDGAGGGDARSGVPFLDHMLDQIARHGLVDLTVEAEGDLEVDDHHTVEDVGIVLGQALAQAWGGKTGIARYGHAYVPLDEALSRAVIDLSGRPGLVFQAAFTAERIGAFDVQLVEEFFRGLTAHAGMTLHLDALRGSNAHHIAETLFKAFGRALRMAVEHDPRLEGTVPSTKGTL